MYYTLSNEDVTKNAEDVQQLLPGRDRPLDYRPDEGLVAAVNVALTLERPLLLTGDPGTGKTQLAYSVAWQLANKKLLNVASPRVERFETKSTSVARDLFYTFDLVGRFQAAQLGGRADSGAAANDLDYITYNALGRAVIESQPYEAVQAFLPKAYPYAGPRRCVALIDEIDKAPRDFPNDLLNEIDQFFFRVPELSAVIGDEAAGIRPIVIITSNSERALPDPFLRRCIYYNIPAPDSERLEQILMARLPALRGLRAELAGPALQFYEQLRHEGVTRKRISVAELLQWLAYLIHQGPDVKAGAGEAGRSLKALGQRAIDGVSALAKDPDDHARVSARLKSFLSTLPQ